MNIFFVRYYVPYLPHYFLFYLFYNAVLFQSIDCFDTRKKIKDKSSSMFLPSLGKTIAMYTYNCNHNYIEAENTKEENSNFA